MRVNPLRVEQAPTYLHITYSLCIHAAALALLVALPVVGVSGTPLGGVYAVALTDKVKQPLKKGALGKTNVRPAGAGVNTVGDKPVPVPITSNMAGPPAKAPRLEETAKPLLTQVHSESLHIGNAGCARKADALHQTKREPPAKSATSETVKPTQSVASPIQEKPSLSPHVSAVLPDPELESVAAMPQRETTPPASDRKIASSRNTIKAQGITDAGSSSNANGFSPETRGRDPVSPSYPSEKWPGTASSLSREFGLFRGTGGVFGEPPLAQRGDVSDKDMPDKGKNGTEEPPLAIRVPEALLVREVKIEVVGDKKAVSDISMGLTIRAHPAKGRKHMRDTERKIDETEIAINSDDSRASVIKTLSLRKAEKSVYIFSLTNVGKATSVTVVFHLSARSENGRMKEYKSFPLPASTVAKFMFLMPEALFWDDTDHFSGIIEDSHTVTKFRYETGLIWKEVKE